MRSVVPVTAAHFARAIAMPNLLPPVATSAQAAAYRERLRAAAPPDFTPLMTLYLTEATRADDVARAFADGIAAAVKLYPAGATVNSDAGVRDVAAVRPVLERMERIGMPLLVHGEVTDPDIDIFDRERVFIERVLQPLLADHPGLRVVMEHITTAEAAAFVTAGPERLGATVTPHHLSLTRNDLFKGGLRPHLYCLPVLKREKHKLALRRAVASGHPRLFLGTDSAPHPIAAKESGRCSAGIFNAGAALAITVQVFEEEGVLDRFEAFVALNGARFYDLPLNQGTLILEKVAPAPVATFKVEAGVELLPYTPDAPLSWRVAGQG